MNKKYGITNYGIQLSHKSCHEVPSPDDIWFDTKRERARWINSKGSLDGFQYNLDEFDVLLIPEEIENPAKEYLKKEATSEQI